MGFICFYCGEPRQDSDRSEEHIVPACIGGTRGATSTKDVCSDCNGRAGRDVDLPFCRDWFIASARLLEGVSSGGKSPITLMGELTWDRPERVLLFLLGGGVHAWFIGGTPDGKERLAIGVDDSDENLLLATMRTVAERFPDVPILNVAERELDAYETDLCRAVLAHGRALKVNRSISLYSWDREFVKIALGLSCKTLGSAFVQSPEADLLRQFLREGDTDKRAAIQLQGKVGISNDPELKFTTPFQPQLHEHLFALMARDSVVVFVGTFFGRFENYVVISRQPPHAAALPNGTLPGVAWVIDAKSKTTSGPTRLVDLILVRRGR